MAAAARDLYALFGGLMNLRRFLRALGGALLYFAIYYGWQLIVGNWASFAASWYAMMTAGEIPPAGSTEYIEWMTSVQNYVYELVMKYSMILTLVSGILALVTFFVIMKARKKRPLADIGLDADKPMARARAIRTRRGSECIRHVCDVHNPVPGRMDQFLCRKLVCARPTPMSSSR